MRNLDKSACGRIGTRCARHCRYGVTCNKPVQQLSIWFPAQDPSKALGNPKDLDPTTTYIRPHSAGPCKSTQFNISCWRFRTGSIGPDVTQLSATQHVQYFQNSTLIPGLVNEVALEIFLYFVAIDRDGPSTLVLVCTVWRDAVLSSKFLQSLRRKRRRPNPALGDKVEEGICIVSFDGGGPGSMSQLRMLEEFMARLAFIERAESDELLPADYFDLMGGVGSGGLVALLLGRLRMTTSQAMEELARIGTMTFPEGEDVVTPEVNLTRLRKALESMLERNGHPVEIKLRDSSENRCKVVLFAATAAVMDHCHPFRTYRSPRKCVDCTLVEAACAIMATPDYFPFVAVGLWPRRQSFAGIPHNFHNPMREVIKETKLVFGEENPVSLMLSLGAGQRARHSNLDHQLTQWSRIHFDGVARDLQDQLRGFVEYLGLNVDKGMENIELDNWHELGSIETYTDVYLEMKQITRYIDRAVQLLLQRNGSVTLGNLSGTNADCVVKFHSESLEKYLAMEFKQMQDVIQELGMEKVTLVDAIGNDIPIPKLFCPTYAMLLDVIKVYLQHQKPPGSDHVERGDYRLLHGSRRSILDPAEWDHLEKVRLKVEMSMILRTRNNDKARCPRCRTQSEAPPTNGWATCVSCSGQFQIEDQLLEYEVQSGNESHNEEIHAEENSIVTPAVTESVQTSQVNKRIEKGEELKFRLISVVNLLDTLSLARASLLSTHPLTRNPASPSQAEAIAIQRLSNLRVPPDAQQAAALLQQRNRLAAEQRKLAQAQAAARNATMASNSAVPPPQAPPNASANPNSMVKTEQDAMAQMNSLQTGKAPFALSMPPVAKRPSTAAMPPSSSPPKGSLPVPPNGTPQRTTHNLQTNDMQQPAANALTASQTPRQTPATPQILHQPAPAAPGPPTSNAPGQPEGMVPTPALASYHQGLVNGQQNQMHTLAQGTDSNGAAGGMRPVYPGMGNTYSLNGTVVSRPPMMPQQIGQQMTPMQQQMMQNAYQMNMVGFGPATQGMHPNIQQQIAQMQQMQQQAAAAVAGSMYAGQNGAGMQANPQAHQAGMQQFNTFIWGKVDASLANMPPERIADFVLKAPEPVKHSAQWAAATERERARIALFRLYKQKVIADNMRRAQSASVANAASNNQR